MRFAPLVWVLAVGLGVPQPKSNQQSHQIMIQFLNFKTAKPLDGLRVVVTLKNANSRQRIPGANNIVAEMSLKTDKSGIVHVDVPVPYPNEITVFAPELVDNVVSQFSIASVMQHGAISRLPGDQSKKKIDGVVDAGQILIFNRKQTAWDRIKREFP